MKRIGRQRGWFGLVGLLIALVIIAWLAKEALKEYRLVSMPEPPQESAPPRESAPPTGFQRSPTPAAVSDAPPGGSTSSFRAPIERARSVESTVTRGAEAQSRRIDDATR